MSRGMVAIRLPFREKVFPCPGRGASKREAISGGRPFLHTPKRGWKEQANMDILLRCLRRLGWWVGLSLVLAGLAQVLTLVVQRFGMQVFNDGLRQTLRLLYQEFEDRSSGETLGLLQKVRTDTERFIHSFVNILFSSAVGIGFLVWYGITKHSLLIPVFLSGILVLGGLGG